MLNQAPHSKLPTHAVWWWLATWFGSGLAPKAPGTAGSLAALPFAFLIQYYAGSAALFAAVVLAFFVGWWASVEYMKYYPEKHDPKEIVVDEVAGMWLVLAVVVHNSQMLTMTAILYLISFILFRFFDALKPWPISYVDRNVKGGFGVMIDDIVAAVASVILFLIGSFIVMNFMWTILHNG